MFGPTTRAEAEKTTYGWGMHTIRWNPERCAENVPEGGRSVGFHQCSRKPGHGPDGLYCKLHDPDRRKAKYEAEEAKRRAEREAKEAAARRLKALAERLGVPYYYGGSISLSESDAEALCLRLGV